MSKAEAIGKTWFNKYKGDCYPKDYLHLNGQKLKPPKYYDTLYEEHHAYDMKRIKVKREKLRKENEHEHTDERLEAKERVKEAQNKMLRRGIHA